MDIEKVLKYECVKNSRSALIKRAIFKLPYYYGITFYTNFSQIAFL